MVQVRNILKESGVIPIFAVKSKSIRWYKSFQKQHFPGGHSFELSKNKEIVNQIQEAIEMVKNQQGLSIEQA